MIEDDQLLFVSACIAIFGNEGLSCIHYLATPNQVLVSGDRMAGL